MITETLKSLNYKYFSGWKADDDLGNMYDRFYNEDVTINGGSGGRVYMQSVQQL